MNIKTIIAIIVTISVIIFTLSMTFIFFCLIKTEHDKLEGISSRIIRVLSNDILLGNQKSLEFTIKKLNLLYNLEDINIQQKFVKCKFYNISCITKTTTMINPELHIQIKGKMPISNKVIFIFFLNLGGLLILVIFIIFIFIYNIKNPLEEISNTLLKEINNKIKNGTEIIRNSKYKIEEIDIISSTLVNMANDLYMSIENHNRTKTEVKIYEAIANSSKIFAHDVRKPFALIKILCDLISQEKDILKVRKLISETLPIINEARISIDFLINDTLDFGKNIVLNLNIEDLQKIIAISINEIKLTCNTSNVNFNVNFDSNNLIKIDKYRILRVLRNLIYNALQGMKNKGLIYIKTTDIFLNNKRYLEFRIKNNNSYIEKENVQKLFDLYYSNNKKNGNGLGLYISKNIIELHNGMIWCESQKTSEEDKFVEFTFIIPYSDL